MAILAGALALLAGVQASMAVPQPPRAVPFDCSWIYHPPSGARTRFEGVYYSFIDNAGFVACASAKACSDWMGKADTEIIFSEAASAQLRRRSVDVYGVFRIVFEGRWGKLGTRRGCEANDWSLERRDDDYVRVERVLRVKRLDQAPRDSPGR